MARRVVVELDVNEDWIEEMAPATVWLDFLAGRIERGVAHRAELVNIYERDAEIDRDSGF